MRTIKLILLQILYAIPIYIIVGILIGNIIPEGSIGYIIIGAILFIIVTYLALLTVRKKLVPGDENRLSKNIAIVLLVIGLVDLFLFKNIYNLVYAVVAYFSIKYFVKVVLKNKVSSV